MKVYWNLFGKTLGQNERLEYVIVSKFLETKINEMSFGIWKNLYESNVTESSKFRVYLSKWYFSRAKLNVCAREIYVNLLTRNLHPPLKLEKDISNK